MNERISARYRLEVLGGFSFFVLATMPVGAADSADAQATAEPLAEIVVTAERREENLSKVPLAVVAFDASTLDSKNIVTEQDMGSLVPGLQVKNGQNSNQLSFSIRGQTLDPFSGTSPAVLTYINEVPYNPGNTATDFYDLQSIQVLKGPQGTLFGLNATGGAVLYSTPMPGDKFDGYAIMRGASRDFTQVQAAIDIPLVDDKLAVRLAGDSTRGNGYVTNVNTGNTLGDKNSHSGRATILFTPSSQLKNVTIVQADYIKGTEGAGNLLDYNSVPTTPGNPATQYNSNGTTHLYNTTGVPWTDTLAAIYGANNGPAAPGFFPGGVEGYAKWSHENPYKVWLQYDLPHDAENLFASNSTEYSLNDDLKIKNIFGYMHDFTRTPGNLAGGPFGALWLFNLTGVNATGVPGGQTFHANTLNDEVQLQGKTEDEKIEYTTGVVYTRQRRYEIIPIDIGSDLGLPAPIADIAYAYRNREDTKAVYGQANYKLTDALTATLGARYTWVNVGITQAAGNVFGVDPNSPAATQSKNLSAPAWTASLQYQIDLNNMVYFSQRGSFRSGNFNGTVAPFTDPLTGRPANFFQNEKVHDFELGYKLNARIAGAPTQLNVAVYDTIAQDAQHALYAVVGGNPAGFTVNVPEATTKGVEVGGAIGLTRWLDLGVNLAYTDAQYTDPVVPIPFIGNLNVDSYPDSPKLSGSASVDVKLPVSASLGAMDLRTDYYGQSYTYFSSTNGTSTPGTLLPGYATLGMRLSWNEIMQTKAAAALYVRNVTDKLYHISGYALGASSGLNTWYPGEPRTIGAELSVKF
jgi:iron complex outermembrane receptor protein